MRSSGIADTLGAIVTSLRVARGMGLKLPAPYTARSATAEGASNR